MLQTRSQDPPARVTVRGRPACRDRDKSIDCLPLEAAACVLECVRISGSNDGEGVMGKGEIGRAHV